MNSIGSDPFVGESTGVLAQCGALCWRLHRGDVQFLLVTSRETRRWIIPKGWPMPQRTAPEAAGIEAWEEAGVRGETDADALGVFVYPKVMSPVLSVPCEVAVHALRVTALDRRYPERKERRRKWFSAQKAMRRVQEPGLKALMLAFAARHVRAAAPAAKTTRAKR